MKQIRLYLYIMFGAFLALFIVGTFVDLQLNQQLFSDKNMFGLAVSAISPSISYGPLAICGGGFLALFLRKEYNKWFRAFFMIGFLACLGCAVYFAGLEYFSVNGFYWVSQKYLGYIIAIPAEASFSFVGYLLFKKCEQKNIWIFIVVFVAAFSVALLAGVNGLKAIMHRPRYRSIQSTLMPFYPWYEKCYYYQGYMQTYGLAKEEFKSFPSGHAAFALSVPIFITFLPIINKEYTKYRLPLFIAGLAYALIVMFTRLLVGAHYLSDVSMGSMLITFFMIVGIEVLYKIKKLSI